jgi:hypothetical protein
VKARTTECPQGHEYTPENTYIHMQGLKLNKHCRKCMYARRNRSARRKTVRENLVKNLGEVEGLLVYEKLRHSIK